MHQILNDAEVYASTWLLTKDHQPPRLYRMPSVYALTATPWKKHIPELTSQAIFLKSQGMRNATSDSSSSPHCPSILSRGAAASCKQSNSAVNMTSNEQLHLHLTHANSLLL